MSENTHVQPYVKARVKKKVWEWLDNDWGKLTTSEKIKIAIAFLRQDSDLDDGSKEIVVKVQHQDLEDRLACYSRN